jgi:hypothetical protein
VVNSELGTASTFHSYEHVVVIYFLTIFETDFNHCSSFIGGDSVDDLHRFYVANGITFFNDVPRLDGLFASVLRCKKFAFKRSQLLEA